MTHPLQEKYTNTYFQHQDGGIYYFLSVGRSTEDSTKELVVYLHVWPFESSVWLRPVEEWTPTRFTPISAEVATYVSSGNRAEAQATITHKRTTRQGLKVINDQA